MRGARTRRSTALVLIPAVLALGCVGDLLTRTPPERRFYRLGAQAAAAAPAPAGAAVLRVDRVRVAPSFVNQSFVYRIAESQYERDYYHAFFSPPDLALRQVLVDWLAGAVVFSTAITASRPTPRWLLGADVEELYADLRDPASAQAVLAITFRLLDAQSPTRALRFEKRYSTSEAAADSSADALVAAWDRALARTLGELTEDLRGAVADIQKR